MSDHLHGDVVIDRFERIKPVFIVEEKSLISFRLDY